MLSLSREQLLYQQYYCEENVWQLASHAQLAALPRWVMFISNPRRAVAMWGQRSARAPSELVAWDYHVVLVVEDAGARWVLDLDSAIGFPVPLPQWVAESFVTPVVGAGDAASKAADLAPEARSLGPTSHGGTGANRSPERAAKDLTRRALLRLGAYAPRFRIVEAGEFLERFASDRSHMRDGEAWREEPPPWPAIRAGDEVMNLFSFVDVEAPFLGSVVQLPDLVAWFDGAR